MVFDICELISLQIRQNVINLARNATYRNMEVPIACDRGPRCFLTKNDPISVSRNIRS